MDPTIFDLHQKNNILYFTLSNINVSLTNAIRRVILSDIPQIVFETLPHEKNKSTFHINTSKFNNEILKQRLACIPVFINDLTMPIDDYIVEVDVKNDTESIIYVTTADFKIKNIKTDKYLVDEVVKEIFPSDPITNEYIDFCRLLPKFSQTINGQHLKFSAKFSMLTAKDNSCYNVVSLCCYGNTLDLVKIEQELSIKETELKEKYEDEKLIQLEINEWKNTTSKRLFLENSFDFKIKSIGVFKNTEILKNAIQIIVNKLKNIIDIYSSSSKLIKESNITISYSFDIILENEDYTIGKIIEFILYDNYYNKNQTLNYCGFYKPHPHINISIIRIAFKNEEPIETVQKYIVEASTIAISIYEKLLPQIN